jgi:xanthine/uracil permease
VRLLLPNPNGHLRQIRRHLRLLPRYVLGGMQVFLYSTIAVAGIRVLGLATFTRRNRFLLTAALAFGFIDIVQPKWFSQILNYSGSNVHLQGFEQGINLIVETPFIVAAVVGVFLNAVLPRDRSAMSEVKRDVGGNPIPYLDGGEMK